MVALNTAPTREAARALDAADPLAAFLDRFAPIEPGLIYLDGNSLGRLPAATPARMARVLAQQWGQGLIRSWAEWIDWPAEVGDRIGAALLGAGPGQVVVADSTSVNLYKLAQAAVSARPGRGALVTDAGNFPTDRYILEGIAEARGLELRVVPSDPVLGPAISDLAGRIDDQVAVVSLSHVAYAGGALLDMGAVNALARNAGALTLWDLSHSAGAVPVELDGTGADLAVGCTYKYLNAGPGAPAFLYVRRGLQAELRQPIQGWFGQREQFAMGETYDPAEGMGRFLVGTPSVLALAAVDEGVTLLAEAGIDTLRAKSVRLGELAVALSDDWLAPLGFRLASPRDPSARGSHVALGHDDGYRICRCLIERHRVIPDFRGPNRIRLGLAPITTRFTDLYDALDRLRGLVQRGEHLALPHDRARVT